MRNKELIKQDFREKLIAEYLADQDNSRLKLAKLTGFLSVMMTDEQAEIIKQRITDA